MKKFLPFLLILCALPVHAATWFFRLDGGTAAQCTGHTNAAYPGSGSAQACALNHPFWLMQVGAGSATWRSDVAANDVFQFEDLGPYYMGQALNGVGTNWNTPGTGFPFGNFCTDPVNGQGTDCHLPANLDGMVWKGLNYGSCHNSDGSNTVNPTVLTGLDATAYIFYAGGSTGNTISCFKINSYESCTDGGNRGSDPGICDSTKNYARNGIMLQSTNTTPGPDKITLTDITIEGMSSNGITGSMYNPSGSGTSTLQYVFVRGNGQIGDNADAAAGSCGTICESQGTLNVDHSRFEFNGCVQNIPNDTYNSVTQTATHGYNYCYGQSHTGNGDGWVMLASNNGFILNVTNSFARWNTQDGFDLVHVSDDASKSVTLNFYRNWSEGNMGAAFKYGVADDNIEDNVGIGNCGVLNVPTAFPMTLNPSGYNAAVGPDLCRAGGDQVPLTMADNKTINYIHNTQVGYGDTMYDISCLTTCHGLETLNFIDNIGIGYLNPLDSNVANGFFFNGITSVFQDGSPSIAENNSWWTMRAGKCPQDTAETNFVCTTPALAAMSDVNAFDPHLTTGSTNIIGQGVTSGIQTSDYAFVNWASPPTIGAFEVSGAPTLVSMAVTPNPGSVMVSSTLAMTCTSTFSDSSTAPCASPVWTDTNTHSSVNSSTGVVTGASVGSDTVTATIGAIHGNTTVNITAPITTMQIIIKCGATCTLSGITIK